MVSHRSGASLVPCCADSCGCPVDRPTDHRGANGAPIAGMDSPHAVSRTIRIRSAEPNRARFPACCDRRGRRAFLPASRRVHPYAATGKNLFFGTGRSILRKGAEFTLVPVAELVLGKQRILELYLNVVEWGPAVYGAESACRYYYRTSARSINRQQAAQLAAILPLPLKRRPDHMNHYSGLIPERMRQMGW